MKPGRKLAQADISRKTATVTALIAALIVALLLWPIFAVLPAKLAASRFVSFAFGVAGGLLAAIAGACAYRLAHRESRNENRSEDRNTEGGNGEFRVLFDTIADSVIIYEPDGRIMLTSRSVRDNLGYGREETLPLSTLEDVLAPEVLPFVPERIRQIVEKGELAFETAHRRKDGTCFPVETRSRLIDFMGRKAIMSVSHDIGERSLAQDEILRMNATLEHRVAERTARLQEANTELEAFSYSISHDLRAPLRAIKGFTCFVQEQHSGQLDDEGKRLLGIVRKNAYRMDQLITDLLNLSRITREEPKLARVDMRALAASVWAEAADTATLASFSVALGDLPPAIGDTSLLRQVWVNLISNAIKYSMKSPERSVEMGGSALPGESEYYVRDHGAGFDPEYAGKLFGVFQRLHGIDEFEGSGVGLAIVKRIVARHGGRVWADSHSPAAGATFHFTIPER